MAAIRQVSDLSRSFAASFVSSTALITNFSYNFTTRNKTMRVSIHVPMTFLRNDDVFSGDTDRPMTRVISESPIAGAEQFSLPRN